MVKFSEIKLGDILLVDYDGRRFEGEVNDIDHEDKLISLKNGDQEFYYQPDKLFPIPLDEEQLVKFNFIKEAGADNSVKYMRGPFRIQLPRKDQFSNFEIWYREDRRHIQQPIGIHQLQNHYHDMTKVDLTRS